MSTQTLRFAPLLVALVFLLAGCDAGGSMNDDQSDDFTVTAEEAAASVALALAQETGGTIDDVEDAVQFAENLTASSKNFTRDCLFDDANVWWACSVSFERSGDVRSRTYNRVHRIQFFDAAGDPQPNYRAGDVTAESLRLTILEGSGRFSAPRIESSHSILGTPTWDVTAFRDSLFFNGNSARLHTDEVTTDQTMRLREAMQEVTLDDVLWVRGAGIESGTITGTYDAEVTITRDGETGTRTIAVSFEAIFEDGESTITFTGGGERFNGRQFAFDLLTGDLDM